MLVLFIFGMMNLMSYVFRICKIPFLFASIFVYSYIFSRFLSFCEFFS